jgi:hypothetical protein
MGLFLFLFWHASHEVSNFFSTMCSPPLCAAHHMPKINAANRPWAETSKSVSPNKPFIFDMYQALVHKQKAE